MAFSGRTVKGMKLAAVALVAIAAFAVVSSMFSQDAAAETVIKIVDGHVLDSGGNPINGADVSVSTYNGATWINTYSTTTDSAGFYTITIAPADWNVGYKIEAQATYNSQQVTDSVIADDSFGQTINLQFPLGIPQFGTLVGFFVAAGLVAVVAAVFLTKKR